MGFCFFGVVAIRRRGRQVVRHGSAKPISAVRFRLAPPNPFLVSKRTHLRTVLFMRGLIRQIQDSLFRTTPRLFGLRRLEVEADTYPTKCQQNCNCCGNKNEGEATVTKEVRQSKTGRQADCQHHDIHPRSFIFQCFAAGRANESRNPSGRLRRPKASTTYWTCDLVSTHKRSLVPG